jgi:hydrogenase maturation protease
MLIGRVVIGVGNSDRGDDAVGLIVARRVSAQRIPGVRVMEHGGESTDLLECLSGAEAAYLIDATCTGERPGTIRRFDVAATKLPQVEFGYSTHGLGLAEAIELARALEKLPRRCVLFAVEGRTYEIGAALSPDVAAAAEEVVKLLIDEMLGQEAGQGSCMKRH